ncbi:Flavanone 3-dioxygenase [Linum perenne]
MVSTRLNMDPPPRKTLSEEEKTVDSSFIRDEDERPKVAYNNFSNDIPVISLAGIDDVDRRSDVCKKIVQACEDWGIFQVIDHGIDADLVSQMTRLAREFFALPPEEKLRFDMSGGKKGGFIVSSHLQGEAVKDWREIVTYFSYPIRDRDYSRWPDKPEAWRAVTEEYSEKLMGLGCKLLEVLSEAMGLEKDALTKACVDMDQKDQVGGLQATRDNGKTWITVKPIDGAFVVNLGDHGHFLSNGRFKNADHQAVVNSNSSRLSIATFQNPSANATVYPLKIREGEKSVMQEAITFTEMYRRKMSKDLELSRLKKLTKEIIAADKEAETAKLDIKAKLEAKPLDQILA